MIIQNYIQCYEIHIHKFYIFLYCSYLILESRSYWSHQMSFFLFWGNNLSHIGINRFWIFIKIPITLPRPRLSPRGIFKLSYPFLWEESESEVTQSCPTLCSPLYQASPPMGFSRQEYWSGVPFPSPGDLPNPGIEPRSSVSLLLSHV